MDAFLDRFRTRLLPALLLATGIALLGSGLLSYTSAVEPQPVARALPSYNPPPTLVPGLDLPGGGGGGGGNEPSFPPDRVATRVVISKLRIDLPVIAQPPGSGDFPLCDVALYFTDLGQPGSGRATYLYAHAREGMFYPLLAASWDRNGAKMIGDIVQVYTSDNYLFLYEIFQVRRHATDLVDAFNDTDGNLWLQTSEGPSAAYPKLQVVAKFLSADKTDPNAAHPPAYPRQCQ